MFTLVTLFGFLHFVSPARAADWLLLQGTEAPDAGAPRPWGFVQALGEGVVGGGPVEGLTSEALAAFDGQVPSFNRVGTGDATYGLSIRRARVGLRGAIPGTDGKVGALLAAELGDNGLTRLDPVVLTDASITVSLLPGARVRIGQFKLPLGEEALEMNPIAAEFINLSTATSGLLLENPSSGGVTTSGSSGFRDLGLSVFDGRALGRGAISYAAMVSNGHMGTLDMDNSKDYSARLSWSPRVWRGGPLDPHRDEWGVYGFWQEGRRDLDGVEVRRSRRGLGAQIEQGGFRARAELIDAVGAIELGASPPFPGQPVAVSADGRATGGAAFVHGERGLWGAGLRYDTLWRLTESPADLRVFQTVTLDLQAELSPRARLMLDYERRWLRAPGGSEDAQTLAAAMGDRVLLQAVAVF